MIYRVEKTIKDVITLHKFPILEDTRLTWDAKGLLTYLLGHGDGWNCQEEDLYNASPDGMGVIKSGLKELREYGYIEKRPIRKENKIAGWESVIREIPRDVATRWGQPVVEPPQHEVTSKKVEKQEGGKARRLKSKKVENLPSRESLENSQEVPETGESSKKVGFQESRKLPPLLILNKEINTEDQERNSEQQQQESTEIEPDARASPPVVDAVVPRGKQSFMSVTSMPVDFVDTGKGGKRYAPQDIDTRLSQLSFQYKIRGAGTLREILTTFQKYVPSVEALETLLHLQATNHIKSVLMLPQFMKQHEIRDVNELAKGLAYAQHYTHGRGSLLGYLAKCEGYVNGICILEIDEGATDSLSPEIQALETDPLVEVLSQACHVTPWKLLELIPQHQTTFGELCRAVVYACQTPTITQPYQWLTRGHDLFRDGQFAFRNGNAQYDIPQLFAWIRGLPSERYTQAIRYLKRTLPTEVSRQPEPTWWTRPEVYEKLQAMYNIYHQQHQEENA